MHDDRIVSLGFATEAVDSARPLLDRARIPREAVRNHVATEALQVDALAHHLAAHEDARNVRVFGSVARADDRPVSDLDLLIDMESGRSLLDLVGLARISRCC